MKKLLIIFSLLTLLGITAMCIAENPPGPPPDPSKMEAEFKNKLDKLVESKVITRSQEDAVIRYFQGMHQNGPPPKPKDNQPPQGQENPLGALVKDGTITPEQAKAIEEILPKPPMPKR